MKDFSIPTEIQKDIKDFEAVFTKEIASSVSLLTIITRYILKTKGKQLRPILVFLSARLVGEPTKSTYSAAYMIELMHTATLVHDDVVDNAAKRRGFFSINALWKNKIAVLVGDYFLSKGLLHAVEHKEYRMLEIISTAVKQMSEGELLQVEKARKLNNTEEIYFEIIRKKTAALFVAAMTCGVVSTGKASDSDIEKIEKIAELLGIAFQIKDDILDYTSSSIIGKPVLNDLKEQKMTLPLLYALSQSSEKEQKLIKHALKHHGNRSAKLQDIASIVIAKGGIDHANQVMNGLCEQAKELCESFSPSNAQQTLMQLIAFVGTRNK